QRQAAGPRVPPLAEIDDFPQTLVRVRQLALMNQQARRHLAGMDLVLNLIERHDDMPDGWIEETECQERGGQLTGYRNRDALERRRTIAPRDHHRTVALAHAGAVRQQHVAI